MKKSHYLLLLALSVFVGIGYFLGLNRGYKSLIEECSKNTEQIISEKNRSLDSLKGVVEGLKVDNRRLENNLEKLLKESN